MRYHAGIKPSGFGMQTFDSGIYGVWFRIQSEDLRLKSQHVGVH